MVHNNFSEMYICGLSNSNTQREYILAEAARRGLDNVNVLTGDITNFKLPDGVEKFECHLSRCLNT